MKIIMLVAVLLTPALSFSQESVTSPSSSKSAPDENASLDYSRSNFGAGIGLDYGGIGVKVNALLSRNFQLSGGVGYNLDQIGLNGGLGVRLSPATRVCPVLLGMYGYNGVIVVKGGNQDFSKTYYGATIGFGLEFHGRNNPDSFFNLELLVPFRSKEFHDKIDELEDNSSIEFKSKVIPVAFSIAYHWGN